MLLWIIFFTFLAFILGSIVWSSLRYGISPMPTSSKVKECVLNSLPSEIEGNILELGAGWGTIAFPLAKRYPNNAVIAYEISWIPYLFCKARLWIDPTPNLKVIRKDFFQDSFREASLVFCYLYPGAMERLKEKFATELPPKALIVTHTFRIPGWTPIYMKSVNDLYQTCVYHYKTSR